MNQTIFTYIYVMGSVTEINTYKYPYTLSYLDIILIIIKLLFLLVGFPIGYILGYQNKNYSA